MTTLNSLNHVIWLISLAATAAAIIHPTPTIPTHPYIYTQNWFIPQKQPPKLDIIYYQVSDIKVINN